MAEPLLVVRQLSKHGLPGVGEPRHEAELSRRVFRAADGSFHDLADNYPGNLVEALCPSCGTLQSPNRSL